MAVGGGQRKSDHVRERRKQQAGYRTYLHKLMCEAEQKGRASPWVTMQPR